MFGFHVLTMPELDALPVGSVVIGTVDYSSERCQNSDYTEIEAGTAWQRRDASLWYPIGDLTVWLGAGKLSQTKPFCIYNPDTYPEDRP